VHFKLGVSVEKLVLNVLGGLSLEQMPIDWVTDIILVTVGAALAK